MQQTHLWSSVNHKWKKELASYPILQPGLHFVHVQSFQCVKVERIHLKLQAIGQIWRRVVPNTFDQLNEVSGKIAIDDSILLKPGPLTAEEFEIIKTHPEIGENICRPLKTLQPVLPIIRFHQERFNGSGYPESLAGEEIPVHARIIGLVDCYDALTTDRTYRKALPKDFALQIMEKETAAGLWDPDLFKLLREILISEKYNLAI